jgi:hypothetical protein
MKAEVKLRSVCIRKKRTARPRGSTRPEQVHFFVVNLIAVMNRTLYLFTGYADLIGIIYFCIIRSVLAYPNLLGTKGFVVVVVRWVPP